jgi:hypothetical protein
VCPVGYELGISIAEDGILHSHRRENIKSYTVRCYGNQTVCNFSNRTLRTVGICIWENKASTWNQLWVLSETWQEVNSAAARVVCIWATVVPRTTTPDWQLGCGCFCCSGRQSGHFLAMSDWPHAG